MQYLCPPLDDQRRIAAILDQADALRRARRRALDRLNDLGQSIFYEMFGDPAINTHNYPELPLGDLASKFSDGPFGSNLKSEHYVEAGVRVIRLQNIGVGEFRDEDQAFISEEHFRQLSKFECLPGDVLVGTLGDPNLRACILPPQMSRALNKADCVQIRVKPSIATNSYVCALLNIPSMELKAQDKILGQTRARISMGRLKTLMVPVPPLDLQLEFNKRQNSVGAFAVSQVESLQEFEALFSSLQHFAFSGELTREAATTEMRKLVRRA